MKELKGLKSGSYESEANGSILEARLYDTGVREVLEKNLIGAPEEKVTSKRILGKLGFGGRTTRKGE